MEGQIVAGMVVVGSDQEQIGTVKTAPQEGIFRVDVVLAPDYYVPLKAVAAVQGNCVMLRVKKASAANMGWELKPKHREGG